MTTDNFNRLIFGLTIFGVVKFFVVAGLVMYVGFAVVIIRQVGIMSEAIEDPLNSVLKLLAWVHFGLALLLVGLAMAVL